jgi:SAM-dependent methyltransferase
MEDDDDVLQEQLAYYRARATTYDASLGDGLQGLQGALTAVGELLQQLGPCEHVLELACGTGIWTRLLVNVAQRVTAVDAAPEMLARVDSFTSEPGTTNAANHGHSKFEVIVMKLALTVTLNLCHFQI